ncbi:MAG: AraC family transcriptional regulator [Thalassobaculaceae bacterium]|nr:AraC family transcriptional regulator [Thalassobaculaceae bacterium]
MRHFESGISMHATDAIEMADLHTEVVLQPGLSALLLLEGEIDVAFDGTPLRVAAEAMPVGRIWSLSRPTSFVRKSARGRHVRKVNITVPPAWFEAHAGAADTGSQRDLGRFLTTQLSIRDWRLTAGAVRKAEQILTADEASGMLGGLSVEQNTLALLFEALSQFTQVDAEPTVRNVSPRDVSRAHTAREIVVRHLDDPLSLPQIARESGMSVSTLQRVFRACFGHSVIEFLRMRRLELARQVLDDCGATVAEAAQRAGYSNPSNFATAFQREFGYPPSHIHRDRK